MLKHLVAGRDLDFVADATRVPRDEVLDIVSDHGYPQTDRMRWAIDMIIQNGDRLPDRATATHRGETPLDEPAAARSNAAQLTVHRRPPSLAVTPPPPARPVHTSIADLLHQASESDYARTRNLAAKISALLADLTDRLTDEQEAHEAKVKADKENAAVTARIATLEAEIAKLKGKTPRKSTTGKIPSYRPRIKGDYPCTTSGCDRTFDTAQGVHLHQRRAHEGFNPHAAGAA